MNEESQVRGCYNFYLRQPGNGAGSPLNQTHSINEESQVRGCYNILFTPTRKQCRLPLKQTHNWQQLKTTCFCRDTGGKRTWWALRASLDTSYVKVIKLSHNQKRDGATERKVERSWLGKHTMHLVTIEN